MIVVDASAVPDHPSGVRTRLRGLYRAYAALEAVPPVRLRVARGSRLFEGLELPPAERSRREAPVSLEEVEAPGGPIRRSLRGLSRNEPYAAVSSERSALWHSETMPALGPRGVPTLVTLHDLRWVAERSAVESRALRYWPRALGALLFQRRWAQRWTGIVTVSQASAEQIVERLGVSADRVLVVPNATAVEGARRSSEVSELRAWRAQDPAAEPAPFFVSVGHLERRKGLDRILQALALPGNEHRFVVVGEGRERAALEREVAALGLGRRVLWLGRRSSEEVHWLLQHAAALLFPSRIEGFGFPVYEALAEHCPVIASPLPCLRELRSAAVRFVEGGAEQWIAEMDRVQQQRGVLRDEAARLAVRLQAGTWQTSAVELARHYRAIASQSRTSGGTEPDGRTGEG